MLSGQEEPRPEGQGPFPLARGAGRSCKFPVEFQLIPVASQEGRQGPTCIQRLERPLLRTAGSGVRSPQRFSPGT